MSEVFLEDRTILVFGGTSGIGRKAVAEFAKAGATVYVGTRSSENFERAKQQIGRSEKLDPNTLFLYPLLADVTDDEQLKEGAQQIKDQKGDLTDVIFSQASGMERFIGPLFKKHMDGINRFTLSTPIEDLNPDNRVIVEDKLATMREDLEIWTEEALPQAIDVNYHGTFRALEIFGDRFPQGFRGVLLNSTWGDLSGKENVSIPLLYSPVERSKGLVRDRLKEVGPLYAGAGYPMAIVIASLVNDTNVGKIFNEFFLNLMDPEQREAVRSSSIRTQDVSLAIRQVLDSDPNHWPSYPYNRYVYKKDGVVVVENSLELSEMYTTAYRF